MHSDVRQMTPERSLYRRVTPSPQKTPLVNGRTLSLRTSESDSDSSDEEIEQSMLSSIGYVLFCFSLHPPHPAPPSEMVLDFMTFIHVVGTGIAVLCVWESGLMVGVILFLSLTPIVVNYGRRMMEAQTIAAITTRQVPVEKAAERPPQKRKGKEVHHVLHESIDEEGHMTVHDNFFYTTRVNSGRKWVGPIADLWRKL
jgi:hypothetical protein